LTPDVDGNPTRSRRFGHQNACITSSVIIRNYQLHSPYLHQSIKYNGRNPCSYRNYFIVLIMIQLNSMLRYLLKKYVAGNKTKDYLTNSLLPLSKGVVPQRIWNTWRDYNEQEQVVNNSYDVVLCVTRYELNWSAPVWEVQSLELI